MNSLKFQAFASVASTKTQNDVLTVEGMLGSALDVLSEFGVIPTTLVLVQQSFEFSSGIKSVVSACPVKTGASNGPETYKNPFKAPASGLGGGRTPNVSLKACASIGAI